MRGWVTIRMADPTLKRSPMQSVSSASPFCGEILTELAPRERHLWQLLPPVLVVLGRIRVYGFLGPAVYSEVCLLIAGKIQFAYRHWLVHGVFEDSRLDGHTLPDNFTWKSHIDRNDLHRCSPQVMPHEARAASARGPAVSVVGEPILLGSELVNHPHAALTCVVSLRLRNSRMASAISR